MLLQHAPKNNDVVKKKLKSSHVKKCIVTITQLYPCPYKDAKMTQQILISLKSTMETPEQCEKSKFKVNNKDIKTTLVGCPGVFIVNFEQISRIVLVFQSLL